MEWLLSKIDRPAGTGDGSWTSWPRALLLAAGFAVIYVTTRSSILIGDGLAFVETVRGGDPAQFLYGCPNHLLQVPLARATWLALGALGLPAPPVYVWVGLSLIGTLGAIVFIGFLAAELMRTPTAGWLAALLFGTSLHSWTQWNGEEYGFAMAYASAGLLFALRGRIMAAALLWACSVLSHAEFFMAAPAFAATVWLSRDKPRSATAKLRRATWLMALAGASTVAGLLLGSRLLGKWHDLPSLLAWLQYALDLNRTYAMTSPEFARAAKGLVTAFTVAGHYWRDIVTGRGAFSHPWFLPALTFGLVVLVLTAACLAAAVSQRRLFVFALLWVLPFELLGNAWFTPTVEKYHAGALPGFVLLVTGGLVYLSSRLPARRGATVCAGFVVICAGLNLFGAVLPMQALGRDTRQATQQLRGLNDQYQDRAVLVTCDGGNALPVWHAGIEYLRLRSIWKGSLPEIQAAIVSWTRDRVAEGKIPHLLERWCYPEEWRTTASKAPFDLYFLERHFRLTPTSIIGVPVAQPATTDPFTWRRGDIVRLDPAVGPQ